MQLCVKDLLVYDHVDPSVHWGHDRIRAYMHGQQRHDNILNVSTDGKPFLGSNQQLAKHTKTKLCLPAGPTTPLWEALHCWTVNNGW